MCGARSRERLTGKGVDAAFRRRAAAMAAAGSGCTCAPLKKRYSAGVAWMGAEPFSWFISDMRSPFGGICTVYAGKGGKSHDSRAHFFVSFGGQHRA